jgi:hypothetical protein
MDLDKFSKMVCDPAKTEQDIKTMRGNALQKGAREHAAVAEAELDRRFPGWDVIRSRKGGAKPTIVRFLGKEQYFSTSKDAYLWLIERFVSAKPSVFDDPSKDTIYLALGKKRNYFGRSLKKMFHGTPNLADNPSNYALIANGWFANINLNNAQKFDILMRFAALAGMEYPTQWDWEVLDPTELLMDKQAATIIAKQLFDEFCSQGSESAKD